MGVRRRRALVHQRRRQHRRGGGGTRRGKRRTSRFAALALFGGIRGAFGGGLAGSVHLPRRCLPRGLVDGRVRRRPGVVAPALAGVGVGRVALARTAGRVRGGRLLALAGSRVGRRALGRGPRWRCGGRGEFGAAQARAAGRGGLAGVVFEPVPRLLGEGVAGSRGGIVVGGVGLGEPLHRIGELVVGHRVVPGRGLVAHPLVVRAHLVDAPVDGEPVATTVVEGPGLPQRGPGEVDGLLDLGPVFRAVVAVVGEEPVEVAGIAPGAFGVQRRFQGVVEGGAPRPVGAGGLFRCHPDLGDDRIGHARQVVVAVAVDVDPPTAEPVLVGVVLQPVVPVVHGVGDLVPECPLHEVAVRQDVGHPAHDVPSFAADPEGVPGAQPFVLGERAEVHQPPLPADPPVQPGVEPGGHPAGVHHLDAVGVEVVAARAATALRADDRVEERVVPDVQGRQAPQHGVDPVEHGVAEVLAVRARCRSDPGVVLAGQLHLPLLDGLFPAAPRCGGRVEVVGRVALRSGPVGPAPLTSVPQGSLGGGAGRRRPGVGGEVADVLVEDPQVAVGDLDPRHFPDGPVGVAVGGLTTHEGAGDRQAVGLTGGVVLVGQADHVADLVGVDEARLSRTPVALVVPPALGDPHLVVCWLVALGALDPHPELIAVGQAQVAGVEVVVDALARLGPDGVGVRGGPRARVDAHDDPHLGDTLIADLGASHVEGGVLPVGAAGDDPLGRHALTRGNEAAAAVLTGQLAVLPTFHPGRLVQLRA